MFLKRGKRNDAAGPAGRLPGHLQGLFDAFVGEGLLEPGFEPLGESDREIRGSIEAKAYTSWIRLHPHLTHLGPEDLRTTFLNRHQDQFKNGGS